MRKGIISAVSSKKYLILLMVIILLVTLYSFFWFLYPKIKLIPVNCPKLVIPERINLSESENDSLEFPIEDNLVTGKWKDGTPMGIFFCDKGKYEGEYVDYFYCRNVSYLTKKIYLKIDLAIDFGDKTDEGYKVMDYKCRRG